MQIIKIYAVILDCTAAGTGGNCRVYCIETEYGKIFDGATIHNLLGNDVIFSNKIFTSSNQLAIGDFIEIPFIKLQESSSSKNPYVLHEAVKKSGFRVVYVPVEFISANNYIDCEKVTEFIHSELDSFTLSGKFYLSSNDLFGPFKIENKCVVPYVGKSAFRYNFNVDEIIDVIYGGKDCSYIIGEPKEKVDELDCMSRSQILEHLKKILKIHHNINLDINKVKELREAVIKVNEGVDHLDHIRLKRASDYLGLMLLSYDELKELKNFEKGWEKLINDNYIVHKEKFEEEILRNFEFKIKEKEDELADILKSLISANETLSQQKEDIDLFSEEIKNIAVKKDDLILSIQMAAGILPTSREKDGHEIPIKFYYSEEHLSELPAYEDCDDYLDDMNDKGLLSKSQKKYFQEGLFWMKQGNFLLADNCSYVTSLARSLGNYKTIIQNAEIDWVKYENLYKNGFSAIVKSALEDESIYHFYILQDINIASPECYAKPILDIAKGLSINIPGTSNKWPKNLFFIGIPVDDQIKDFGFELNKSTFFNWKALPQNTEAFASSEFIPSKRIDLDLINISFDYLNTIECYIL